VVKNQTVATPATSGPSTSEAPAGELPMATVPLNGPVDGGFYYRQPASSQERFWVGTEYLMWWTKKSPEPVPLVTTSPDNPLIVGISGIVTSPTTTVLLGNQPLNSQMRSGGRFTAGFWLNDEATVGVEGSYLFL